MLRAAPAAAETADGQPLPPAFASRTNPLAGQPGAAARGRALFADHCAPCHGETADGRGPAAAGLKPPPADLARGDVVVRHSDAYLFYRLSSGKRGSAMPSFQHALSETERWEIVTFLRSLAGRPPGATLARPDLAQPAR